MASPHDELMTRREALQRVSALLGGVALVGHGALLSGCTTGSAVRPEAGALFAPNEIAMLAEIADTILPPTATPGAKAAGVGPFIATMVTVAYDVRQQRLFMDGLATLERECRRLHGTDFMATPAEGRLELLQRLDREQWEYMGRPGSAAAPHYFRMLKELALLGYFTSEIGCTQAQRYVETPGRYEPCVTYSPGDKAWAPHA